MLPIFPVWGLLNYFVVGTGYPVETCKNMSPFHNNPTEAILAVDLSLCNVHQEKKNAPVCSFQIHVFLKHFG